MPATEIAITGYRSIKQLFLPLRQLTVLVGGNGVGKTNLYRSLELLHAAARGTLALEIAREGGLGSIHFAGERKSHEKPLLVLSAELHDLVEGETVRYEVEVGFPMQGSGGVYVAAFATEAQIKRELLTLRRGRKDVALMERRGPTVWVRVDGGKRTTVDTELLASDTALSDLRGGGFREIDAVRQTIANWRFYHGFRTDAGSLLRRPSIPVTSAILNSDGSNLAAVFATLQHIRNDTTDLRAAFDVAFPGAELNLPSPDETATFSVTFPETPKRAFEAHELSDGTLQFLALMGALLSYRLPPFIALNEPEASLHPSLLPALAGAIVKAAERTQIWVVTHSEALASAITDASGVKPYEVVRDDEGTHIKGLSKLGVFNDE